MIFVFLDIYLYSDNNFKYMTRRKEEKFVPRVVLKQRIFDAKEARTTISFYRYFHIVDPQAFKERLMNDFGSLGVLGRIYVAYEGINAQISLPSKNVEALREYLDNDSDMVGVPFKIAVEDDGKSFYKLTIKVRDKVLADGLNDKTFDVTKVGQHLSAEEYNKAIEDGAILIDMRNHYETEVGHFEGAYCPDADTFRDLLPHVEEKFADKKEEKILLYCTGGIRCEKASAYLKHKGFKDVNQLSGGIIQYAHEIKEKGLESKYKGKNFVFDERLGEKITDDILSQCHQCGQPCDDHTNCKNDACHLLFIQCSDCASKMDGCCTVDCMNVLKLPAEAQTELRKKTALAAKEFGGDTAIYKSRLRPRLKIVV